MPFLTVISRCAGVYCSYEKEVGRLIISASLKWQFCIFNSLVQLFIFKIMLHFTCISLACNFDVALHFSDILASKRNGQLFRCITMTVFLTSEGLPKIPCKFHLQATATPSPPKNPGVVLEKINVLFLMETLNPTGGSRLFFQPQLLRPLGVQPFKHMVTIPFSFFESPSVPAEMSPDQCFILRYNCSKSLRD